MSNRYDINARFDAHNEQLQTYTTILSMIRSKARDPRLQEETLGNPQSQAANPHDSTAQTLNKLLSAIACLLVRQYEVVCVTPKRLAVNGLLELSAAAEHPFVLTSEGLSQRVKAAPRPTIYIARNPSQEHTLGSAVSISRDTMVPPEDIFQFLIDHRDASFELHTQTLCSLINRSVQDGEYDSWKNTTLYVLVSSAGKIKNRFSSKFLEILDCLTDEMFNDAHMEQAPIIDKSDKTDLMHAIKQLKRPDCFQALKTQLDDNAKADPNIAKDIFKLLVCLLKEVQASARDVHGLMKSPAPGPGREALVKATSRLLYSMTTLHGLAYSAVVSFIFTDILKGRIAKLTTVVDLRRVEKNAAKLVRAKAATQEKNRLALEAAARKSAASKAKLMAQLAKIAPHLRADFEANMRQAAEAAVVEDAVPEYDDDSEDNEALQAHDGNEMSPEENAEITPSSPVTALLSWLHLVPSTVHYTSLFYGNPASPGFPIKRICFDVITYPKSFKIPIDWEGCIEELCRGRTEAVFASLRDFDTRFTRGTKIKFPGRVHCEAFLATMHLIAKKRPAHAITMDTGILAYLDPALLQFGVSEKCCPTCASILRCIFHEFKRPLQIVGTHANVCPCAFPPGLPKKITTTVVKEYKELLRTELLCRFSSTPRTASTMSEGVELPNFRINKNRVQGGMGLDLEVADLKSGC